MKIIDVPIPEFQPTDLQATASKDAYAETTHEDFLLGESQRQLRLRSRHIAASALRHARQAAGGASTVNDAAAVKLIEMIADALGSGVSTPSPFSRETRVWLAGNVAQSVEKARAWEVFLRGAIRSAESEIALDVYLLFEMRVEQALRLLRQMQAAIAIEAQRDEIAEASATWSLRICRIVTGEDCIQYLPELRKLHGAFLRNLAQLLRYGSEAEIRLNLARFWNEQVAVRVDCSAQEWFYLVSACELETTRRVGMEMARVVQPYFEILAQARQRYPFCGAIAHSFPLIAERVKERHPGLRFAWSDVLLSVVGEIVLTGGNAPGPLTTVWRTAKGEGPVAEIDPAAFRAFSQTVVGACRSLAERYWLDWLEEGLGAIARALDYRADRRLAHDLLVGVAGQAAENLRQGLDVFRSNLQLEKDLALLLDAARFQLAVQKNFNLARTAYRAWFVQLYAAPQAEGAWQHAKTIVRALRTAVSKDAGNAALWQRYEGALQLIDELPEVITEAQLVLRALPYATAHGLPFAMATPFPEAVPLGLAFIKRLLMEYLRSGRRSAVGEMQKWLIEEGLPTVPEASLEDLEQVMNSILNGITHASEFELEGLRATMVEVQGTFPATVLSVRLWLESETMAEEVTAAVFEQLPNYAAQCRQSAQQDPRYTHLSALPDYRDAKAQAGTSPKHRDLAVTLRRVALSFEPGVSDRRDFLNNWWSYAVNPFLITRPYRLFTATREEIALAMRRQHGVAAAALVESTVRPFFDAARTEAIGDHDSFPPMEPIVFQAPVYPTLRRTHGAALAERTDRVIESFLREQMTAAFALAMGTARILPPLDLALGRKPGPVVEGAAAPAVLEANLHHIAVLLSSGFAPFEWTGVLSTASTEAWQRLTGPRPALVSALLLYLEALQTQTDTIVPIGTRVRLLDYLQAVREFLPQSAAGEALRAQAKGLADQVADVVCREISRPIAAASLQPESRDPAVMKMKTARDLELVFKAFANFLCTLPPPLVLFSACRYVTEKVAPYTQGFGDLIWRVTWQQSSLLAGRLVPLESGRELTSFFESLEDMGGTLTQIAAISHKLNANDKRPVFNPNPAEESQWCRMVTSILTLAQMRELRPDVPAAAIRLLVCGSLRVADEADFGQRLNRVQAGLQGWFPQAPWARFAPEFAAMKETAAVVRELERLATSGEPAGADPIDALSRLVLLRGAFVRDVAAASPTSWGLPFGLKLLNDATIEELAQWSDAKALAQASSLPNGSSAFPREALASSLAEIAAAARRQQSYPPVWALAVQGDAPGLGLSLEAGRQLLRWTVRRLAVDAGTGRPGAAGTIAWYWRNIVAPRASGPARTCIGVADVIRDTLAPVMATSPEVRSAVDAFLESLPGLMAAGHLRKGADRLAKLVVDRAFVLQPFYAAGFGSALTPEKLRERVTSDTRFHLLAVASALLIPAIAQEDSRWWRQSLHRFLSDRSRATLPYFLKAMADVGEEELSVEEALALSSVLQRMYASEIRPGHFPGGKRARELANVLKPDLSGFWRSSLTGAFRLIFPSDQETPYVSLTWRTGPVAPAGTATAASFLEANLSYVAMVLQRGWSPFQAEGLLDRRTTQEWRALLVGQPTWAVSVEALLLTVMGSTESVTPTLVRLQVIDYLQAFVEFNRQCGAGLALQKAAVGFGEVVADAAFTEVPALAQKGVTAGTTAEETRSKGRRDLALIFAHFGKWMSRACRPFALFEAHYYLVENLLPFVPYGETVMKVVMQQAALRAEEAFGGWTGGELQRWFRQLESCGRSYPDVRPVKLRFTPRVDVDLAEGSVPDLAESQRANALLTLLTMRATCPEAAATCRLAYAASLRQSSSEDHAAQFGAILASCREWLVELDLSALEKEVTALQEALAVAQTLESLSVDSAGLATRLAERVTAFQGFGSGERLIPQIESLLLQSSREALAPRTWISSFWGLPAHARLLTDSCVGQLEKLPAPERDRLRLSLTNILAGKIGPEAAATAGEFITKTQRLADTLAPICGAFWGWKLAGSAMEGQSPAIRRDLHWISRRILLDAWLGTNGAAGWTHAFVLSTAAPTDFKTMAMLFQATAQGLEASAHHVEIAAACRHFSGVGGLALWLRRLDVSGDDIASRVLARASSTHSGYTATRTDRSDVMAHRDLRETLSALARVPLQSNGLAAEDLSQWWRTSIETHLQESTREELPSFAKAILEVVQETATEPEHAGVRASLATLHWGREAVTPGRP